VPFAGGVRSRWLDVENLVVCTPRPAGPFTGLAGRKPAPIIAAFSSSCVGSLIGDRARGELDAA